jgi:hydroxymethylbilane synthase
MRPIRIATRASKLAMTQSGHVRDMIKNICPDAEISFVQVSTQGDRDKSDFLYKTESVGVFTSEVENALLHNEADVAVHSLKDLPTQIQEGLIVAAIPTRQQTADVLVSARPIKSLDDLPQGATVGTSSLRRIAQLKHLRPDLDCQPLRGNVETRVGKALTGEMDAIVIAQAGLNRMEMADNISVVLDPQEFIPAPGQGALGIQTRAGDTELIQLLASLDNPDARITTDVERKILAELHGGCSIPLGVYSTVNDDNIKIIAVISDVNGVKYIRTEETCKITDIDTAAKKIAEHLLSEGGKEILSESRKPE